MHTHTHTHTQSLGAMQEAQALGTQAIVLNAIIKAAGRLKDVSAQPDPMQEAAALGALTILLPQLEEPGIPETLSDVVPNIMALLASPSTSVQVGDVGAWHTQSH